MQYRILYACTSHIGNVRGINQDNFSCDGQAMLPEGDETVFPLCGVKTNKEPSVFGVFDGLGGEERGEIASCIAAKSASALKIGKGAATELLQFCQEANGQICGYAEENGVSAMGTTAAMLAFTAAGVTLCNIGDSKVFRLSGDSLEQISRDHVVAAPFGKKPPLSQNLGIPPSEMLIDPYVAQGSYRDGDLYLICSDGLTDMVTTEAIEQSLKKENTPEKTVAELLRLALENGGKDNVTLILCRIEKTGNRFWDLLKKRQRRKEK